MKNTIYYFSGTGNSLYIAKHLADQLGESQLVPLAKANQQSDIIANTEKGHHASISVMNSMFIVIEN